MKDDYYFTQTALTTTVSNVNMCCRRRMQEWTGCSSWHLREPVERSTSFQMKVRHGRWLDIEASLFWLLNAWVGIVDVEVSL